MARFRRADRPYTYSLKPGEGNRGMFRAQSVNRLHGQVTQPTRQAYRMSRLEETRYAVSPRIMKPMGTLDTQEGWYKPKTFQSQRAAQSAKNADLAVFKQQYGRGSNRFRRGNK